MLQNVDTMIGFVMVMLVLSLLITVLVQAMVAVFELRGKNLIASLTKLLLQIEPELRKTKTGVAIAREVSTAVAMHPSLVNFSEVAQGKVGRLIALFFSRPAKGIDAHEWLIVLNNLATNPGTGLSAGSQALLATLHNTVVAAPSSEYVVSGKPLVDQSSLSHLGQNRILEEAAHGSTPAVRQIVAGTYKWFDAVMERSSDWFTTQSRVWTVVLALALSVVFRIDSLCILRQLSDNPEVRAKPVQNADAALSEARNVQTKFSLETSVDQMKSLKSQLDQSQLTIITSPFDSGPPPVVPRWFSVGTLITGLLLTLGAPFWFNALSQLANLRPSISDKLDKNDGQHSLEPVASMALATQAKAA